ncbi:MAG: ABC transporter ATP-binding protein [Bacillota bacterium]|nr:ABC transporter ATP-binding protein [Bacillota bacterium]
MSAAITLTDVSFIYPGSDFSFSCSHLEFPQNEVTLITGHNGSGKTTLSKLMCGILKSVTGRVDIFNRDTKNLTLGEVGKCVGYLFQEPTQQLFTPTVWREMTFVDEILGRTSNETERKALDLLEWFGLTGLKERSIYYLSRGEQQRLALCTLLMSGANFFILDEPTTGLDKNNRKQLYTLMDDLVARGKGFAVITHEGELIDKYAYSQVRLEKGKVIA